MGDIRPETEEEANARRRREDLISSSGPIIRSSPPGPPRTSLEDPGDSYIFHVEELLERNAQGKQDLSQEVKTWLADRRIAYTLDIRPEWAAKASTIQIFRQPEAVLFKLTWIGFRKPIPFGFLEK